MEDLQIVETIVRKDPKVIEQCGIIGIPPEDMHKVYCDREFPQPHDIQLLLMEISMDHRLRRALWHKGPSSASPHVLPSPPR